MVTDIPWRERIELGLKITDELGSRWVAIDGEDFNERIELAVSLTETLSTDWIPVFCYCGQAKHPVSETEIATALKMDLDEVTRCLRRLEQERLVEEAARAGTYVLAVGKRVASGQIAQPSHGSNFSG